MYRQLSINVVCIRYSRFSLALVKLRLGRFCRTMFGLCIDFFRGHLLANVYIDSFRLIYCLHCVFNIFLALVML